MKRWGAGWVFAVLLGVGAAHADETREDLRLAVQGPVLEFKGKMIEGSATRLREALDAAPAVRIVKLDSRGGRWEEARQMAELIRSRGLSTYVRKNCLSACGLVFLAGQVRYLHPWSWVGLQAVPGGPKGWHLKDEDQEVIQEGIRKGLGQDFAKKMELAEDHKIWRLRPEIAQATGFATHLSSGEFAAEADPAREGTESAILQRELFQVLVKIEPAAYRGIFDAIMDLQVGRKTEAEAKARMNDMMKQAGVAHLRRIKDRYLVRYAWELGKSLKSLARYEPALCDRRFEATTTSLNDDVREEGDRVVLLLLLADEEGSPVPDLSPREARALEGALEAAMDKKGGQGYFFWSAQRANGTLHGADRCDFLRLGIEAAFDLMDPERARLLRHLLLTGWP